MGLKQKKKVKRRKEYCRCRSVKQGEGIVDDKVVSESVPTVPTDIIVQEILNKRKLRNLVDRINQIKIGSGFAYA